MDSFTQKKAFIYLAAALLGVAVLVLGLPGLHFEPGQAIPGAAGAETQAQSAAATADVDSFYFPRSVQIGFIALFCIVLVLILIYLVKKTNLKTGLLFTAGLALVTVLAVLLNGLGAKATQTQARSAETFEYAPSSYYNVAPIGEAPAGFAWVVMGLVLLLALGGVAWLVVRTIRAQQPAKKLAGEATAALHALADGLDLKDVILRSYQQMAALVSRERGIEREESATPREFEKILIDGGLPPEPVRELTRLFEKVRYGARPGNNEDKRAAAACFTALRDACLAGVKK
jgi:hypothetical protein